MCFYLYSKIFFLQLTLHKPNSTKRYSIQCCVIDLNTAANEEEQYYNWNKS